MKTDQCEICSSDAIQVKLMLASLRSKIMKQSQQYVPDYKQEDTIKQPHQGFSRLLMIMFGHKATSHASFTHCQHTKFSRYFRRKLRCNNETFNSLCSQIANKMAQRNYQLEILHLQIGSIGETAAKEAENPLAIEERVARKKEKPTEANIKLTASRQELEHRPFEHYPNLWLGNPPLIHFPWMYPQQGASHQGN